MIGLRSQAARGASMAYIGQGAQDSTTRCSALNTSNFLQVGSSPLGAIRRHPLDMRAPVGGGPGMYRWPDCAAVLPGASRF